MKEISHTHDTIGVGKLTPYLHLMRLHQRAGIWLLMWPCWWSIALAAHNASQLFQLIALFFLGSVVMRSAGCVVNDIWDRKIDAEVERTKNRPLASGALQLRHAFFLLFALLSIGLIILYQLPIHTFKLGLVFTLLVVIYPLMKRVLAVPQVFLGITFNAGALMGWSAAREALSLEAWLLFAACFFWTLGYDTIYAHQDKKDDAKLGVHSSALAFGKATKRHVSFYYAAMIALLTAIGVLQAFHLSYYCLIGLAALHLLWQVRGVDLDNPADCMATFRSNIWFGWLPFMAILIQKYHFSGM